MTVPFTHPVKIWFIYILNLFEEQKIIIKITAYLDSDDDGTSADGLSRIQLKSGFELDKRKGHSMHV